MRVAFLVALLMSALMTHSQQQVWDITFTELQISQNKQHYKDNVEARNNQLMSRATVEAWKRQQQSFKELVDNIDQWVNQGFIVLADAVTAYEVYSKLRDLLSLQGKAFGIMYKYPWAIPVFLDREQSILQEAQQLAGLIYLLAATEGQANKMRVAQRAILYRELREELQRIVQRSKTLCYRLQAVDYQETIKQLGPVKFANHDVKLVNDIIHDFKF